MRHPVVAACGVAVHTAEGSGRVLGPAGGLRDVAKSLPREQKAKAARSNAVKGV